VCIEGVFKFFHSLQIKIFTVHSTSDDLEEMCRNELPFPGALFSCFQHEKEIKAHALNTQLSDS
jgi:hypothetical protein